MYEHPWSLILRNPQLPEQNYVQMKEQISKCREYGLKFFDIHKKSVALSTLICTELTNTFTQL